MPLGLGLGTPFGRVLSAAAASSLTSTAFWPDEEVLIFTASGIIRYNPFTDAENVSTVSDTWAAYGVYNPTDDYVYFFTSSTSLISNLDSIKRVKSDGTGEETLWTNGAASADWDVAQPGVGGMVLDMNQEWIYFINGSRATTDEVVKFGVGANIDSYPDQASPLIDAASPIASAVDNANQIFFDHVNDYLYVANDDDQLIRIFDISNHGSVSSVGATAALGGDLGGVTGDVDQGVIHIGRARTAGGEAYQLSDRAVYTNSAWGNTITAADANGVLFDHGRKLIFGFNGISATTQMFIGWADNTGSVATGVGVMDNTTRTGITSYNGMTFVPQGTFDANSFTKMDDFALGAAAVVYYIDEQTITAAGGASIGAGVTLSVDAIDASLPIGAVLEFSGGGFLTLTVAAAASATSLQGDLATANIIATETATAAAGYFSDTLALDSTPAEVTGSPEWGVGLYPGDLTDFHFDHINQTLVGGTRITSRDGRLQVVEISDGTVRELQDGSVAANGVALQLGYGGAARPFGLSAFYPAVPNLNEYFWRQDNNDDVVRAPHDDAASRATVLNESGALRRGYWHIVSAWTGKHHKAYYAMDASTDFRHDDSGAMDWSATTQISNGQGIGNLHASVVTHAAFPFVPTVFFNGDGLVTMPGDTITAVGFRDHALSSSITTAGNKWAYDIGASLSVTGTVWCLHYDVVNGELYWTDDAGFHKCAVSLIQRETGGVTESRAPVVGTPSLISATPGFKFFAIDWAFVDASLNDISTEYHGQYA
jgi:hypothetical protein